MDRNQQVLAHAAGLAVLGLTFWFLVLHAPQPWKDTPEESCLMQMNNETREAVEKMSLMDYPSYYHCVEGPPVILKAVLLMMWLGMMISLLASTADNFFVPQLETMSERLHLSEDVAGVTLLALGNGMPDVMTANSALGNEDEDGFGMMMGEFMGAGNFIVGFILAVVLLMQKGPTQVDGLPFLRDTAAYIAVLLLMVAVTWDRVITLLEAFSFFLVYGLYVALVVVPGRMRRGSMARQSSLVAGFAAAPVWPMKRMSDSLTFIRGQPPANTAALLQVGEAVDINDTPTADVQRFSMADDDVELEEESNNQFMLFESDTEDVPTYEVQHLEGFGGAANFGECMLLTVEWPFTLARHVTIPAAQWSPRRRQLAALCPIFGPLIVATSFYGPAFFEAAIGEVPCWTMLVTVGVCCGIAVLQFSTPSKCPTWHSALLVFSFVTTVAWFKLFADETVALLNLLGLKLGASASILGATVLAWGNCVGDLVADTALVRKGKAKMAVAEQDALDRH
eukprot:CAMPEP_0178464644 /NCGR_PEP_ID=MMETSP0689_2-20121128/50948_1 /TAXON_ID=160604 /ORGANISM="Amphidinium massartii, Strain CS-259" /LENGTH=508 /DNA_ID=CAMNT_0020091551 /DNA_START=142 /DNA_END=1668 /DNA_ORIENTATION=+